MRLNLIIKLGRLSFRLACSKTITLGMTALVVNLKMSLAP